MQILIRRQGVSVRAAWQGLAKPSDKQLHYWLRTKPVAPVINPLGAAVVTDILTAAVLSHTVSAPVEVRSHSLILNLMDVIENRAITGAGAGAFRTNILSALRQIQNHTTTPATPTTDPRLTILSLDGYGPRNSRLASLEQVVEGTGFAHNTLRASARSLSLAVLQPQSTARDDVVVLRAPLPSGPLIQPVGDAYDYAPAPTDPNHMELVTQVDDPLAHTHWSRTPKPTHFAQESQLPSLVEPLRTTPPEILFLGGVGNTLRSYGNGATTLCNAGSWGTFRKRGKRGAISILGTNGLEANSYKASAGSGQRAFVGMANSEVDSSGAGQWKTSPAWQVAYTGTPWVSVDFGHTVSGLNGIGLYSAKYSQHLKRGQLQYSHNGVSWYSLLYFYVTGDYSWQVINFASINARHLRIRCLSNWGNTSWMRIDRVEVYMV